MGQKKSAAVFASIAISISLIATAAIGAVRSTEMSLKLAEGLFSATLDDFLGEVVEIDESECSSAVNSAITRVRNSSAPELMAAALGEMEEALDSEGESTPESFAWLRDSNLGQSLQKEVEGWWEDEVLRGLQSSVNLDLASVKSSALQTGSESSFTTRINALRQKDLLPDGVLLSSWQSHFERAYSSKCSNAVQVAASEAARGFQSDSRALARLVSQLDSKSWQGDEYTKLSPLVAYSPQENAKCSSYLACARVWVLTPVSCEVDFVVEFTDSAGNYVDTAYETVSTKADTRKIVEFTSYGDGGGYFEILEWQCN